MVFAMFMRELVDFSDFDIMIEAKAKDLAPLRLREQLVGTDLLAYTPYQAETYAYPVER